MTELPWCDYCGQYIMNKHDMVYAGQMADAIYSKYIHKHKGLFKKLLYCFICVPVLLFFKSFCFCNQKHKDLFAKRIGLKIRRNKK